MKAIILADLFVILIFALLAREEAVISLFVEDREAYQRFSDAAPKTGDYIKLSYHDEERYISADEANAIKQAFFDKCVSGAACTIRISITKQAGLSYE